MLLITCIALVVQWEPRSDLDYLGQYKKTLIETLIYWVRLGHATGGARVLIWTCWGLRQRLVATWAEFQHSVVYCATEQCRKNWKHELMQVVVTLNTCCDTACLTFQLPHITTGSLQSHWWQPTTGSLESFQRLRERNKPSVRWKSFAIHKLVWWHFQVGWASRLQIVSL